MILVQVGLQDVILSVPFHTADGIPALDPSTVGLRGAFPCPAVENSLQDSEDYACPAFQSKLTDCRPSYSFWRISKGVVTG